MTSQELKNSILQLAIQGKLVEQRPEEGTGEELFCKLKRHHSHLKPCKDELDFSSMDFDIPDTWTMVELNQLFDFVDYRGRTPNKTVEGIFLITASNIKQGYMDYTRKEYISEQEYAERMSRGITKKGDLLFTTEAPMGNAALCDLDICSCGQRIITFQEYEKETAHPPLFMYFILSPQFQKQLLGNCTGTTAKGIKADKLKHFKIPLPPFAEQKRIVAKIEELLPLIDRYEKAWTRLEEFNKRFPDDLQKSILQMAIQGKLVEQRPEEGTGEELYQKIQAEKQKLIREGKIKKEKPLPEIMEEEKPFEIPESWKWVRLIELGFFSSGKTPTMGESKYWDKGTVEWFTSKDMKKKYLVESEMKITELAATGMTKYPAGTLLMVVRSGILKRMLPLCILTQESTINQDIKAYCLYDTSISEYVYYMIKGLEKYILEKYRKQVTTVDSLKFDEFSREMLVPLPPLAEQKRIVARLEELLPMCQRLAAC